MSRGIKFRGKRIDNGEWVYGDLCQDMDIEMVSILKKSDKPYALGDSKEADTYFYFKLIQVDPETVGQFTGQRDEEHDTDIYEGDIIEVIDDCEEEHITIIEFREGAFVADVYDQDYDETALGWAICCWDNSSSDWEIIGNKWDNPELLEVALG